LIVVVVAELKKVSIPAAASALKASSGIAPGQVHHDGSSESR
jgi:hypothetical protein